MKQNLQAAYKTYHKPYSENITLSSFFPKELSTRILFHFPELHILGMQT